jgi:hypothetical protein
MLLACVQLRSITMTEIKILYDKLFLTSFTPRVLKQLTNFSLDYTLSKFRHASFVHLAEHTGNLETLKLSLSHYPDVGLESDVIKVVENNQKLKVIELTSSNITISIKFFECVLTNCAGLTYMCVYDCIVPLSIITRLIVKCTSLHTAVFKTSDDMVIGYQHNQSKEAPIKTIQFFNVFDALISQEQIHDISQFFHTVHNFTEIKLSNIVGLNDDVLNNIKTNNEHLLSFEISNCGAEFTYEPLGFILFNNNALTALTLQGISHISSAMLRISLTSRNGASLEEMTIAHHSTLTTEDLQEIMTKNSKLCRLVVSKCPLVNKVLIKEHAVVHNKCVLLKI